MISELEKVQETCRHLIIEKARMQQEIDDLRTAMFDVIGRMDRHCQNLDAHKE